VLSDAETALGMN
jgi:hypothetical protein